MPIQLARRSLTMPRDLVDTLAIRLAIEFTGTLLLATLLPLIEVSIDAANNAERSASALASIMAFSAATASVCLVVWALAHGAHLNPILTMAVWLDGRRFQHGDPVAIGYIVAQAAGATLGVAAVETLAGSNRLPAIGMPAPIWRIGTEFLAATGLVVLFLLFTHYGRGLSVAASLGGYSDVVTVAGWSASLANPAIVLAAMLLGPGDRAANNVAVAAVAAQVGGAIVGIFMFTAGEQWRERRARRKM